MSHAPLHDPPPLAPSAKASKPVSVTQLAHMTQLHLEAIFLMANPAGQAFVDCGSILQSNASRISANTANATTSEAKKIPVLLGVASSQFFKRLESPQLAHGFFDVSGAALVELPQS